MTGATAAGTTGVFKTYSTGYQHIIDTMKHALPGIRITVIQASPFDDVTRPPNFDDGYNAVLVRYGQFVKELGEREGLLVADLNGPVVSMLEKAKAEDPELAKDIIKDRGPSWTGRPPADGRGAAQGVECACHRGHGRDRRGREARGACGQHQVTGSARQDRTLPGAETDSAPLAPAGSKTSRT